MTTEGQLLGKAATGSTVDGTPSARGRRNAGSGSQQTLSVAHTIVRDHGLRHLAVLDSGKLVGIVSQRDT